MGSCVLNLLYNLLAHEYLLYITPNATDAYRKRALYSSRSSLFILFARKTSLYAAAVFLGFFVPYFDRLVALFPTPPLFQLAIALPYLEAFSHPHTLRPLMLEKNCNTHQIHSPPDQMIPHTRTILTPSSSDQDYTMLLYIMPFPWYVCCNHPSSTQSYSGRFPLGRIGFLGFGDPNFQTYTFELRCINIAESGGNSFASFLLRSASLDQDN